MIPPESSPLTEARPSKRVQTPQPNSTLTFTPVPGGVRASARLISQQAVHTMSMKEALRSLETLTPKYIMHNLYADSIPNYAHFASPMVHPTMGETITSYECLINDPEIAKVWQTVLSKDFGGMAHGDNKTGQKGTNLVFVITRDEIDAASVARHTWTYACIVVNHQQHKKDPNQIQITVGGNLITYKGDTSTQTADLTMLKLLWNSILSTMGPGTCAWI